MSTPERVIAAVKQNRADAEALYRAKIQRDEDEKRRIKELQDNAGDTFAKALRMNAVSQRIDEIIEVQLRAGRTSGHIAVRGVRQRGWCGYDSTEKRGLEPLLSALGALLSYETPAIRAVWNEAAHEWSVERYNNAVRLYVGTEAGMFTACDEHLGLFWKMV